MAADHPTAWSDAIVLASATACPQCGAPVLPVIDQSTGQELVLDMHTPTWFLFQRPTPSGGWVALPSPSKVAHADVCARRQARESSP